LFQADFEVEGFAVGGEVGGDFEPEFAELDDGVLAGADVDVGQGESVRARDHVERVEHVGEFVGDPDFAVLEGVGGVGGEIVEADGGAGRVVEHAEEAVDADGGFAVLFFDDGAHKRVEARAVGEGVAAGDDGLAGLELGAQGGAEDVGGHGPAELLQAGAGFGKVGPVSGELFAGFGQLRGEVGVFAGGAFKVGGGRSGGRRRRGRGRGEGADNRQGIGRRRRVVVEKLIRDKPGEGGAGDAGEEVGREFHGRRERRVGAACQPSRRRRC